jgi:drug/metabolite transporter (DMT)-like permease
MNSAAAPVFRPFAAALWMGGSIASFTLIAIAGRSLKHDHDVFEIMFYRSLIGIVVLGAVALALRRHHEITLRDLPLHGLRAVVHYAGQGLWLWALMLIPLAQLFALEFTTPLWVMALSPLLLGESITRHKVFAAALGFAGVLAVARPDITQLDPGVLAALASALCFAFNILFTKRLTRLGTILNILFWLTAFQLVIGLVITGHDGHITPPSAATLPWLAIVGLGALGAHYSLTKALSLAPASFVIPIDFARLPLIAVVGVVLYAEPLESWLVFGAALILSANWINLRHARS